MGRRKKSRTVGYKYHLGMHMALCHGPVDLITRIRVADRTVWSGMENERQIVINKPNIFGGEEKEGGIAGDLDIAFGGPAQTQNEYLRRAMFGQSRYSNGTFFGGPSPQNIPTFRGVVSAILKAMYIGTNPYLKNWSFRLQRVHVRQDGLAQWYPDKAAIVPPGFDANLVFDSATWKYRVEQFPVGQGDLGNTYHEEGYDDSRWQEGAMPFGDGFTDNSTAANNGFRGTPATVIPLNSALHLRRRFYLPYSIPGGLQIDAWVDNGITVWINGEQVINEYNRFGHRFQATIPGDKFRVGINTIAIKLLDDEESEPFIDRMYIDLKLPGYVDAPADMNPAHIIRECLTDPDWGLGYADEDIDDAAFMAAADALHDEGMGISILWNRETPIEDFINEIIRHIDAALYVDRTTGKFVLKLIRGDYDKEALPVLGRSEVDSVQDFTRPTFGELINSVVLTYWDSGTGKTGSVSAQDIAMVAMQGGEIIQSIDYPGFTRADLVARVAARDLKSLSIPLATATIIANRAAKDLTIGSVFKLDWPDYTDEPLVMRVTGIAHGDGRSNAIRIQCTEDVFALPTEGVVVAPPEEWQDPDDVELDPLDDRLVMEMPYYELVQRMGQSFVDDRLAENPLAGYLAATAINNGAGINARLMVDVGSGYEETSVVEFSPGATLTADVDRKAGTFPISPNIDIEDVELGSLAQIGSEIVRVDAITSTEITVGRGCLDTVPTPHAAGDKLFFYENYARSDAIEYAAGEVLDVKLLPIGATDVLALEEAPVDQLTMDQRAMRPYPPGNFQINGELYPPSIAGDASAALTWAHRDRLQQTSGDVIDTTAGDVGPEAGTTYNLRIYGEDNSLGREELGLAGTSYFYDTALEREDFGIPYSVELVVDEYWAFVQLLLPFNGTDASTDIQDFAKFARPITVVGNARIDTARFKFGGASLRLDGSGDYLTVPHDTNFSLVANGLHFTVDGWFYVAGSHKTRATILSKRPPSGTTSEFQIDLSDGSPLLIAWDSGGSLILNLAGQAPAIPLDEWVHLEWSFDGATYRIFMNGQLVASAAAITPSGANTAPLHIGRDPTNATRDFDGWIDDLRITSGVARHTANFTPPQIEHPRLGPVPNAYTEDFEDEPIGALPADWQERLVSNDVAWQVVAGKWLSVTTPPGANANRACKVAAGEGLADVEVLFKVRWTGAASVFELPSVLLRARGSAPSAHAYQFLLANPSGGTGEGTEFWIRQNNGGGAPLVLDTAPFASSPNTWYWIRARAEGSHLKGKVWADGDPEPGAWTVEAIDTAHPSGWVALHVRNQDITYDFDDFSLTPIVSEFRLNGRLRIELEAERNGLISLQKHDYTVLREGYGFNYGELYGAGA